MFGDGILLSIAIGQVFLEYVAVIKSFIFSITQLNDSIVNYDANIFIFTPNLSFRCLLILPEVL